MNDPWFAIINPAAGNGRALRVWEQLQSELDKLSIPHVSRISRYPLHISEIARAAHKEGRNHFISVGGDGTHHELINGLLSNPISEQTPVVAIANAGTGNDWSRTHKISGDANACARLIKAQNTILHSAGKITFNKDGQQHTRYFVNVAGMALDGRVVERFPSALKNIPFLPGYLIAGLRQLFIYRAPYLKVESRDISFEDRLITVHAGISKYSGGGMQFVPHAVSTDDTLAVTCIQNMSIPGLLAKIPRLYTGTILSHPKVKGFTAPWLKVSSVSGEPVPIEADGEFLGYTPVNIEVIESAFRLVTHN